MDEQFLRTQMLLGDDAMARLQRSRVAVFGVGGVGGYVVEALVRSGVGAIDIIDADCVDVTNINRQLIALHSTIGRPKVEVCRERILDINPECSVVAHQMFYLPENADAFDLKPFDYVIDCIDTVTAKIELIRRCHALGVPLISSMGAANKLDPMGFRVSDISKTQTDPLARVLRRKLRELRISRLLCVWSPELPRKPFAETSSETKRSVPASVAFVPSAAGLLIAATVICNITEQTPPPH